MGDRLLTALPLKIPAAADFGLMELPSASGLRAQLLPTGALFSLRHEGTLLNQLLPGPAEDGLFRLLVRWRAAEGPAGWAPLVGPTVGFARCGPAAAAWTTRTPAGLECTTVFQLHPRLAAWAWRVHVRNAGSTVLRADLLHAQDLGLADEGAVRNNEAYTSQYIDLLPVPDDALGWVILARQNQAMAGGRFPWLALACVPGAAGYCTDGVQFFGADHRLTGEPAAVRDPALPSQRLQYECALGGLQSRTVTLAPGATTEYVIVARFLPDHPAASGPADLAVLRELLPPDWIGGTAVTPAAPRPASVFLRSPWLHGDAPAEADWAAWFPGARRHEERDAAGRLQSFFHGADTHVVARDKEAVLARPHGHILRSGTSLWIDDEQFGLTCYAAGVFAAQVYLGNPSFTRLLSVVRNALNVARASGQRVFVRRDGEWRQLGLPSAFVLRPGEVRWIYRCGDEVIEARAWCARVQPASFLELRVTAGAPCEFLVTHQVVVGATEFDHAGEAEVHAEAAWIGFTAHADSLMGRWQPGACFALAAAAAGTGDALGGDGLLYADGVERDGPYATLRTRPVTRCGVILLGTHAGPAALAAAVAAARREFAAGGPGAPPPPPPRRRAAAGGPGAQPPPPPLRLRAGADPGIARIDEVLPWYAHNASIHFSAPHGLEQYGGAAWGVRDVCQGSVEWLLAAGEFPVLRRILLAVFSQQYRRTAADDSLDGSWPQWFMHPPFRFIQQAHSHGDVCFWPVKALCDYVEASNDLAFLHTAVGYTDPAKFEGVGPLETLWAHCDRVIALCESRFVPGTALVNYGDGDWDDTLQPADPAMRTRMVSAWTVGLAYHAFRLLGGVCRRAGETARAGRLDALLARMRADFAAHLLPGGVVAGFLVTEPDGRWRPLLHPQDEVTGIHYRLLPMTRSMLAELFTPDEARRHLQLIDSELSFPDGVRLMNRPSAYQGGRERFFKRADTAANVGREIGLHYVHANLRYVAALAKVGEAEKLWAELQRLNPVALRATVPTAEPRQSNVYFSSSDADFADRHEAAERWEELRRGKVPVRGGWRLYSSGPGLFLHLVRSCLLGLRESFDDIVFDPVLPASLDGLVAEVTLCRRPVTLAFRVRSASHSPASLAVNGHVLRGQTDPNPYRKGGLRVAADQLAARLTAGPNRIEIEL